MTNVLEPLVLVFRQVHQYFSTFDCCLLVRGEVTSAASQVALFLIQFTALCSFCLSALLMVSNPQRNMIDLFGICHIIGCWGGGFLGSVAISSAVTVMKGAA